MRFKSINFFIKTSSHENFSRIGILFIIMETFEDPREKGAMLVKKDSKVSVPTVIQSSSSQTLDEDKDLNGPGKRAKKLREVMCHDMSRLRGQCFSITVRLNFH